jgi:hypothetical protein
MKGQNGNSVSFLQSKIANPKSKMVLLLEPLVYQAKSFETWVITTSGVAG